eukprot:3170093-Ditylum_brightwellii.AAC.1
MECKPLKSRQGYMVYVSRTYTELAPYLKGLHNTLESWRLTRDEDGWKYTFCELLAKYGVDPIWQEHKGPPEFVEHVT